METPSIIDAKLPDDSSTSGVAAPELQDAKAAAEVSSTSAPDAKEIDSVDSIIEAATKESPPTQEEVAKESSPEETAAEEKSGEVEPPADSKNADVPFHEHPRWKEKLQELETVKTELAAAKPNLERVQHLDRYCQQNRITQQQFSEMMEVAALLNSDPAKAWERLQPLVTVLSQYTGASLPEDLQREVDDGAISASRAKEIARLRADTKVREQRNVVDQQQQQQAQSQQAFDAINRAVTDWTSSKKTADPLFQPKKAPTDPDGLWEFARMRFNDKIREAQPKTPQEVVALAEQAYQEIKKSFGQFVAPKKQLRTLPSHGSSIRTKQEVKSPEDVIELYAGGGKLAE